MSNTRLPAGSVPTTAPVFSYWPSVAVPLAVHSICAPAASVAEGHETATPRSSVTAIPVSAVLPVL